MRKMDFLKAYIWMYGVGRRTAHDVWKEKKMDTNYVDEIIAVWKEQCKRAFNND